MKSKLKIKAITRWWYLLIGTIGIIIVAMTTYSYHKSVRMSTVYAPLIVAAHEIKLEATTAHLWFEEIMSSDRHEDMESVWKHQDQADWYAQAVLEGGTNFEGTFIPLDDAKMRQDILDVRTKLSEFRDITAQRWAAKGVSGAGTDIDQRYDAVFEDFIRQADKVEARLQQVMAHDLAHFRFTQIALIVVTALLSLFAGIVFFLLERTRTNNIIKTERVSEKLRLRVKEMYSLNSLFHRVSANISLEQVVQAALDEIDEIVSPDLVLLFLRKEEKMHLQGFRASDPGFQHKETPVHIVGECLCGLAVKDGVPVYSDDINNDPRCGWEECKEAGLKSFVAFPLQGGEEIIGVLGLASGIEKYDFKVQSHFLETLSNEAAIGLQNAILYDEVRKHDADLSIINEKLNAEVAERRQTEKVLKALSGSLEQRVAERTLDLTKTNNKLEQSIKELQLTQRQLVQSEKMATLGQLAASVAHEINNPLSFISSNFETLTLYTEKLQKFLKKYEGGKPVFKKEETAEILAFFKEVQDLKKEIKMDVLIKNIGEIIEESTTGVERIKSIVDNLRLTSRISDTPISSNINSILDGILVMVWGEIKYNAEVIKEYEDIPEITCHPQQLGQVFMNLIVNAAHSLEGSGKIGIKTYQEKNAVCIEIKDNGRGIPEELQGKIFDPFFTTKELGQGTGLGLSVAYNIIQRHSGQIYLSSKVGKGTTFTVTLPMHGMEASAGEEQTRRV